MKTYKTKITVLWENDTLQDKTFDNDIKCIEWLRKNHEKILQINGYSTFGKQLDHWSLMFLINSIN